MNQKETPPSPKEDFTVAIVRKFITSKLSPLFLGASLFMGLFALFFTPREEEPQIVVPVMDVFVEAPGTSAKEVEKLVATPLEEKLREIDGVEYVYSTSMPGRAIATVRFYVGQNREDSLLKTWSKLMSNEDIIPPIVSRWLVKPVEIDDVPIVLLTLSASSPYSSFELRRIAEEMVDKLGMVENTGKIWVAGGERRQVSVIPDPAKLAAFDLTLPEVMRVLQASNANVQAGVFERRNHLSAVESGPFFVVPADVADLVISSRGSRPVYLREVARIEDGPEEAHTLTRIGFGPALDESRTIAGHLPKRGEKRPAVTIAIPKRRGANAVTVAHAVIEKAKSLFGTVVPTDVTMTVSRDYGQTADHKVNELVKHLLIAVAIVIALLAMTLGAREAFIVAIAVPMTLGVTLLFDLVFGYTINRVTLFALILALGLLVDDPIVDVENIHRHFMMRREPPLQAALRAIDEVRPPTIFATFAVIVSFLPMSFITGMMGPYMAPMAFNVPVAMLLSLAVAFTVTPWASYYLLRREAEVGHGEHAPSNGAQPRLAFYRKAMGWLLASRARARLFLAMVLALFVISCLLPVLGLVPLKLLPLDNKNELQFVIDMPLGTPLEKTDAVVRSFEDYLESVNEVTDFESYVGLSSPMDFNGMVRRYYLREGSHKADIRINLLPKEKRSHYSHQISLRIRPDIDRLKKELGANVKIVEVPPGPPVLSTLTVEIYGPVDGSESALSEAAKRVRAELEKIDGVVDVDDFVDAPQNKFHVRLDRAKAALHGIRAEEVARTLAIALGGAQAGTVHLEGERNPLGIVVRLARPDRSSIPNLLLLRVRSSDGGLVPLSELCTVENETVDQTIYHKNLKPLMYVIAEVAGRSPVNAILDLRRSLKEKPLAEGYQAELAGDGEMKITVEVFRDLGIAFAAALVMIYVLLVAQTNSLGMPLVIMMAIPLTVIGIMPGFWILRLLSTPVGDYANPTFFTATAMIGMIGLAGIVVRNSIILIDFVHHLLEEGKALPEALIEAGAVRLRPIFLTASAAMFASFVITVDPIFSGLAWSFIFGIFASTGFTLFVIPVTYFLFYGKKPVKG